MKSLIAVMNCRSRQSSYADAVRRTWMPLVPRDKADAFFFVGRGEGEVASDTIVLDCDDSYQGLPEKVRAITRWAHAREEYSHMLKCDDDVVLKVDALLASGYDRNDYTGRLNRPICTDTPYTVPMGFNYWLSRKCMAIVKDAELPPNSNDDEKWVAGNLHKAGISLVNDDRYRLSYGVHVARPFRREGRVLRRPNLEADTSGGAFSWCVFLEGNSGNRIPLEVKLREFHLLFAKLYPGGAPCVP
jgi:hypothetical protein